MIFLHRMDKQTMYLNPDHIVSVEETPDTVITLFNGNHSIVMESAAEIISRIVAFRARIIRRSGMQTTKKYLSRPRRTLYSSVGSIEEENSTFSRDRRLRTPFHSQDQ